MAEVEYEVRDGIAFVTLHLSDDFRESATAFLEKRARVYHGR